MSTCGSENRENLDNDPSRSFVTVIAVDYARHRAYPQPPEEYSDYGSHSTEYSHLDTGSNQLADSLSTSNIYKPSGGYAGKDWETQDSHKTADSNNGSHPMNVKICVYLMTNIALHMDVENGANVTVQDLIHAVYNDDQLRIPRTAFNVFTLWMTSGLLELQLKPHHKPINIRSRWSSLLNKYAHASESRQRRDEPVVTFQRNIYFPKSQEERIKDERVLDLLYAEAKNNVIEGRYPCEHTAHYIMLASIQARIELGPYNPQVHTLHFFRDNLSRFLPAHLRTNNSCGSWFRLSSKDSPEVRLLEHYKRLPDRKLQRKYLEFCWALPYYGSAFFQGQIEQPVRGLTSLITHQDIPVLVAINAQGVYVINNVQCVLLLGLKYDELSWDFAKPSQEDNPDCLPCLFLQFRVVENGTRVSKILQIFSKQAVMMDALITGFVEDYKQKMLSSNEPERTSVFESNNENSDVQFNGNSTIRQDTQPSAAPAYLCNKLSKLTLATFDEEGRCIGQMGSWSFSY